MLALGEHRFAEFVADHPAQASVTPIQISGEPYVLVDGPVTSWVAPAAAWQAALQQPITGRYSLEPDDIYAELCDLVPYDRSDALRYEDESLVHRFWA